MLAFQVLYPEQLLNGTIAALADLVIFIGFQNRRIEQDSLTGIGNRKSLFAELSFRMARGQAFQVMVVGLEQFSRTNQMHGYRKGDGLLRLIARRLDRLGGGARAFRFGNVEFAIVRPMERAENGTMWLERVCQLFREEWVFGGETCRVNARVSEVIFQDQMWSPEQLIESLEFALHLAREEQMEFVRLEGEVAQRYQQRSKLIQMIQQSIQENRYQVWYQPIYCTKLERFAAAEALLRLTDEHGEVISPEEFIPLAEQTGLIDPLSWLVLETVCCLLGEESLPGLEWISVNLSIQQICSDLPQRVGKLLQQYHVEPDRLKLEITERALMEDADGIRDQMAQMAQQRVRFYLDDFGTGYSNLSCALDLPFEGVKLDRSLVTDLAEHPNRERMAETLIPFFQSLGLEVVAEGIESETQAQRVRKHGVDCIQGFYYAKPMPKDQVVAFFHQQAEEMKKDRRGE
ncbi:MAG: putative bifunctional diguanylate cyclase/phosphodiesterase [Lawsonibacter sp.]